MSNPATQNSTASPSTAGVARASMPRMAIHAATGASISDAPSQKWARAVNRFVSEYAATNASTGPARTSGHQFGGSRGRNSSVDATNPPTHTARKATTAGTDRRAARRGRAGGRAGGGGAAGGGGGGGGGWGGGGARVCGNLGRRSGRRRGDDHGGGGGGGGGGAQRGAGRPPGRRGGEGGEELVREVTPPVPL